MRVASKLLMACCAAVLAACAQLSNDAVIPRELIDQAEVAGLPGVRIFGDIHSSQLQAALAAERGRLAARYAPRGTDRKPPTSDILAISGGADDGAFSAGLLVGWGQRGNRPTFDIVTGISAGALVAPFAFLGRDADPALATIFTENAGDAIYTSNPIAGLFGAPSVADNAPLANLIAKYVDHAMLRAIAAERRKGRYLLIGTTHLAAQRPVYWDMGRIAEVGTRQALELFRNVLLASTAVPGVFPPVPIKVRANGKSFEEYHVDGGPTREVFLSPASFSFRSIDAVIGYHVERRVWVIRNGILEPEYENVGLTAASISVRALNTLTKNQGIGDIIRIYNRARADGIEFNLASIPPTFKEPRPALFDKTYMTALYNHGVELGRNGYAWAKKPPGAAD